METPEWQTYCSTTATVNCWRPTDDCLEAASMLSSLLHMLSGILVPEDLVCSALYMPP